MIFDFKARGGGKFRVYVRNEQFVSSHDDEREAAQQCVNAYLADATSAPYYKHEAVALGSVYVVDLIAKDVDGSIVLPPPDPVNPPVNNEPTEGAVDILEKLATLIPDPTHEINAASFEAALPIFAARYTDWFAHALVETDPATAKKRLVATAWKGILIVWKWSQIDILARNKV